MRRVGLALALAAILLAIGAIQAYSQRKRVDAANSHLDQLALRMEMGDFPLRSSTLNPVSEVLSDGAETSHRTLYGIDVLMIAAAYGDEPAAKKALADGIVIDRAAPTMGSLPKGLSALGWAAETGEIGMARFLISRGAQVNDRDSVGWTALHSAVHRLRLDIVRLLLDHGAQPDPNAVEGFSLVHLAVQGDQITTRPTDPRIDEKVIELLIARGSRINHIGDEGRTPLDLARDYGNTRVVALLKRHGGMAAWQLRREHAAGRRTRT